MVSNGNSKVDAYTEHGVHTEHDEEHEGKRIGEDKLQ